jgi:hypothetical protein
MVSREGVYPGLLGMKFREKSWRRRSSRGKYSFLIRRGYSGEMRFLRSSYLGTISVFENIFWVPGVACKLFLSSRKIQNEEKQGNHRMLFLKIYNAIDTTAKLTLSYYCNIQ